MTAATFLSFVQESPAPFWVALRNGDQVYCLGLLDVLEFHVLVKCDDTDRIIQLDDIQSVSRSMRTDAPPPP